MLACLTALIPAVQVISEKRGKKEKFYDGLFVFFLKDEKRYIRTI